MNKDEDWSLEAIQAEAPAIRDRLNRFRLALGRFLVEKQELIDLMVVAAIAQEPLLLVGPPGTAKSDLVLKFKDALGITREDYFEYMLTRFTEPSEILGPIDIGQLREGRYIRREQGKLPTAQLVFLDEIFKSNSAILNILLTIINERKFYQDGEPQPVRLKILFAATNEIPEQGELSALKDRFVLKAESRSVQETHFEELIDSGLQSEVHRAFQQKPWAEGIASLTDILKAGKYITWLFSRQDPVLQPMKGGRGGGDRQQYFPTDVFKEFQRLIKTLARDDRMTISDRRVVKLYKLLRTRAWLFSGGVVSREDLRLLAYVGESHREITLLRERIPVLLG